MLGQISPLFLLSSLVEVVLVSIQCYALTTSSNRPTEEEYASCLLRGIFSSLSICDCESTKRLKRMIMIPC